MAACAVGVVLAATSSEGVHGQPVPGSSDAQRLIGTWKLVAYESTDPDIERLRGAHPMGLLFYDRTGHMSVQIAPDRTRRRYTGPVAGIFTGPRPTAEEAIDAVTGYTAYFGTYSVNERTRTVTHQRTANLNPGGLGDFPRRYEFQTDDRLVLTPLDSPDLRTNRLTWERVK
jgi:hypothetical protein